jgi:hypothetical protein
MRLGKKIVAAAPLMPAERFMLAITLGLAVFDLAVVAWRGTAVDWPRYAAITSFSGIVLLIGLFYRLTGRSERLATTLVSTASFVLFTMVASAFTYQLLPVWREPIDPWLANLDGMLGFHWPDALAFAASRPWLAEVTRYAYVSSLPQFAVLVLVLGFSGRTPELGIFMLATVVSCLFTIAVWALFPSFGTTTVFEIDPAVEAQLKPIVGSAYGAELRRLAAEGPLLISSKDALGTIAAPSFHTVMALLAVYSARTVPWLWPGALAINVMVLPAVLFHGGHHLVDVFAGVAVTVLGIVAAKAMVRPVRTVHATALSAS